MNPWARRKGKSDYAEWFPELDLHVASRWERAAAETHSERLQAITHTDVAAEENELEPVLT